MWSPRRCLSVGLGVTFRRQWEKDLAPTTSQCGLKAAANYIGCASHNGSLLISHHVLMVPMACIKHTQPLVLPGKACHSQPDSLVWSRSSAYCVTNGTDESVSSSGQRHRFSPSSVSCVAPVRRPEPQPQGWVLSV